MWRFRFVSRASASSARGSSATCTWRWRCGAGRALRLSASGCCPLAGGATLRGEVRAVRVTARFCEPSSELHIAEDWYRRTALCDLLALGDEEVNKDRLYRGLDRLLAPKEALEAHLSPRCGGR